MNKKTADSVRFTSFVIIFAVNMFDRLSRLSPKVN